MDQSRLGACVLENWTEIPAQIGEIVNNISFHPEGSEFFVSPLKHNQGPPHHGN